MVFLKRLYAGLGHTGLVEDAFQRMRRQEHLNEADVKISASRLWKVPTDSALLGDTYRYREVSSVESTDDLKKQVLPTAFFTPQLSKCSIPVTGIASLSSTAPWPSSSPPWLQFSEDLGLLDELADKPDLSCCVWRTQFLEPGMIVKHKKCNTYYFTYSKNGAAALAWPLSLKKHDLAGKSSKDFLWCYEHKTIRAPSELQWLVVTSFSDWVAVPYSYYSPLHVHVLNKGQPLQGFEYGTMVQTGVDLPLLKLLAQQGFWTAGKDLLKKLCKDSGL